MTVVLGAGGIELYMELPLRPVMAHSSRWSILMKNLPSWVPNFAMEYTAQTRALADETIYHHPYYILQPGLTECMEIYPSCGVRFSSDHTTLYTTGLLLGVTIKSEVCTLRDHCPPATYYKGEQLVHSYLCQLLGIYHRIGKRHGITKSQFLSLLLPSYVDADKERTEAFEEMLRSPQETASRIKDEADRSALTQVLRDIFIAARENILFVTNTGRIGKFHHHDAPNDDFSGDILVGLFGISFPFVLRPNDDGTYRIINVAFVLDHEWGHDFVKNAAPETPREEFEKYGLKEYAIV
ncbi:hypothetical protein BU23DRAFT_598961 [Bimuria novae-zelandiae CBS 107.79]|uniref:Heterokaryon incompatibility domain-containing protein n=1 Tax=Bimuria novae-zelandiae CBS 107.79 TaxID=1447943 RepID=A0A6A5VC46_9PLEO|nr:hypothetical protein BU23DRAFT_598961 [Bimuria novae-zelandiae CBS 107.79]